MSEKPETRGRKPQNKVRGAMSSAERKMHQIERQLTRINELDPEQWTRAECLLVLSRKDLVGLTKWALIQLAKLHGFNVTITKTTQKEATP